jgi:hypothetical protein
MRDPHDPDHAAKVAPATDSHAAAKKPRRKVALPDDANRGADQAQNGLDVPAAVPLHLKPVLSYAEVAAVGIAPERTLRRLVATGRVKRSVIRLGRSMRFVVQDLLDELRQGEE